MLWSFSSRFALDVRPFSPWSDPTLTTVPVQPRRSHERNNIQTLWSRYEGVYFFFFPPFLLSFFSHFVLVHSTVSPSAKRKIRALILQGSKQIPVRVSVLCLLCCQYKCVQIRFFGLYHLILYRRSFHPRRVPYLLATVVILFRRWDGHQECSRDFSEFFSCVNTFL